MGIVALEGADFFAYHGFSEEERKIGNKYSVDIQVRTDLEEAALEDNLDKTVDYGELYKIIRQEMEIPSRLLESVAKRIVDAVYQRFPFINSIEISISKYNPPIGGICHRSRITLEKHYK